MTNCYLDCIQYAKRAPTGLILSGYTGNMGRISPCIQGASSLTVPATTVALAEYDFLYLFDGPKTEVLQVGAAGAAQGVTSIPLLNPTTYAHNAGVAYCTDGTDGSLGEQILTASQWVEDICHQSLWQSTYTETLRMPTMRASIDNQHSLNFRPRHSPVTAPPTSLVIQTNASTSIAIDPSQAIIDSELELVSVPNMAGIPAGGNQGQSPYQPLRPTQPRQAQAWLVINYTAGYAVGDLPYPVQRACSLLTNQCFTQLVNPIGADSQGEGKRNFVFTMRGDTTGESLLLKEVMKLLQPYIVEEA